MWPFDWLRRRNGHTPPPPTVEAAEAIEQAQNGLRQEVKRSVEVTRVADALRRAQIRNHFSEAMEALMKGTKP